MHTYVHAYIHTYTHTYIYIYLHMHDAFTHTHTHTHSLSLYIYIICTYRCLCIQLLVSTYNATYAPTVSDSDRFSGLGLGQKTRLAVPEDPLRARAGTLFKE